MNGSIHTRRGEKTIKELFIGECWEYLRNNFQKFSEANKIKIALTLAQKDLPQQINGNVEFTEMPVIQREADEATTHNRIAGFLIGSPPSPQDTRHT